MPDPTLMTRDDFSSATADPAGDAVAPQAAADPVESRFKDGLEHASYYSTGRMWDDYAPAYRFGLDNGHRHAGRRFEEVESELQDGWGEARQASRLGWVEARGAVEDAWQHGRRDEGGNAH